MATTDGGGKIRHEWYQTPGEIVLSIFIRNAPKDGSLRVLFTPRSFSLSLPSAHSPTSAEIAFDLEPLAHEILISETDGPSPPLDNPSTITDSSGKLTQSWYRVISPKIEVHLAKKEVGLKWGKLEGEDESLAQMAAREKEEAEAKRGYPTSSKKRTNWDKLADDVKKEEAAGPDKGDPNSGGDGELSKAFQQLYQGASDDARKAMLKSYQESNGTTLSTNWDEVGKSRVETKAPEGMIAKKWKE